jgi:hypothetical protein
VWLSRLKIGINFFKYYTDLPLANVGFFLGFEFWVMFYSIVMLKVDCQVDAFGGNHLT